MYYFANILHKLL